MYLFMRSLTHVQPACMCVCVFFILSTPCHLPPSLSPSLCSFPPSLLAVQWGEAGLESKVQVCRLADESQRGSFPPTVCKYVVTLIERSSSSQQLSFLLFRECVCVCVKCVRERARPQLEQQETHGSDTHRCAKITHTHDNPSQRDVRWHTYTPGIQWLL